jgi:predicted transcriptional regulator
MAQRSDTELLADRLDAILTEKAALMKRIEELSADEQRIKYALDVFRSVLGGLASSGAAAVQLGSVALNATGGSAVVQSSGATSSPSDERPTQRQTLESIILNVIGSTGALTSIEVADAVKLTSDAQRNSVLSTLSRMASKGRLRKEGKLYFLAAIGEGSEVGKTSEPSVATMSGEGQATSEALTDGKGDIA